MGSRSGLPLCEAPSGETGDIMGHLSQGTVSPHLSTPNADPLPLDPSGLAWRLGGTRSDRLRQDLATFQVYSDLGWAGGRWDTEDCDWKGWKGRKVFW